MFRLKNPFAAILFLSFFANCFAEGPTPEDARVARVLDYYAWLELEATATTDQIKKAFRRLAMTCHPDKFPGDKDKEAKFREISEAYEVLSDRAKRARFDRAFASSMSKHGRAPSPADFDPDQELRDAARKRSREYAQPEGPPPAEEAPPEAQVKHEHQRIPHQEVYRFLELVSSANNSLNSLLGRSAWKSLLASHRHVEAAYISLLKNPEIPAEDLLKAHELFYQDYLAGQILRLSPELGINELLEFRELKGNLLAKLSQDGVIDRASNFSEQLAFCESEMVRHGSGKSIQQELIRNLRDAKGKGILGNLLRFGRSQGEVGTARYFDLVLDHPRLLEAATKGLATTGDDKTLSHLLTRIVGRLNEIRSRREVTGAEQQFAMTAIELLENIKAAKFGRGLSVSQSHAAGYISSQSYLDFSIALQRRVGQREDRFVRFQVDLELGLKRLNSTPADKLNHSRKGIFSFLQEALQKFSVLKKDRSIDQYDIDQFLTESLRPTIQSLLRMIHERVPFENIPQLAAKVEALLREHGQLNGVFPEGNLQSRIYSGVLEARAAEFSHFILRNLADRSKKQRQSGAVLFRGMRELRPDFESILLEHSLEDKRLMERALKELVVIWGQDVSSRNPHAASSNHRLQTIIGLRASQHGLSIRAIRALSSAVKDLKESDPAGARVLRAQSRQSMKDVGYGLCRRFLFGI